MQGTASLPESPPQDDAAVAGAIAWAVRLRSGEAGAADWAAFEAWCAGDPRHHAAFSRLEQALGTFGRLPAAAVASGAARRVLLKSPARRKALRNTLGLALLGAGGAGALHQLTPLQSLTADLRTATGERRRVVLEDGSELWLNARSAVDVAFDAGARLLRLRAGEIIVSVAADPTRPFVVRTAQGAVHALGTRFAVRSEEAHTLLAVLHSAVRVDTAAGQSATLAAGRSARFDAERIETLAQRASDFAAWAEGFVEVHDRPLGEVIAALRPYHTGFLQVSDAAAALRVTGAFPLDDRRRTLTALAESLPITVRQRTPYWIGIGIRPGGAVDANRAGP
jgi:transmembrane sensor